MNIVLAALVQIKEQVQEQITRQVEELKEFERKYKFFRSLEEAQ